jgi:hypothetical protein
MRTASGIALLNRIGADSRPWPAAAFLITPRYLDLPKLGAVVPRLVQARQGWESAQSGSAPGSQKKSPSFLLRKRKQKGHCLCDVQA